MGHRDPKELCPDRALSKMISEQALPNCAATHSWTTVKSLWRHWGAVERAVELELGQVPARHFLAGGF